MEMELLCMRVIEEEGLDDSDLYELQIGPENETKEEDD